MNGRRRDLRVFGGVRIAKRQSARCCARALGFIALAIVCSCAASAHAGTFATVAVTGQNSPDSVSTLLTFTPPALNDAGQVAFLSQLANDDIGLYRGTTSALTVIARSNVTMLDGQPITNFVNNSPSINGAGTVSHAADRATAPNNFVAFLGSGGALSSYLSVGSSSPTGMNALFQHTVPVINGTGVTAYRAAYSGINPENGVYSRTAAGVTTLRFQEGEISPGLFATLTQTLPTINEASQIGLTAGLDDGLFTRKAVLRLDGNTPVTLAQDNTMTTDSVTAVGNILSDGVPINSTGQVAFEATYTQASVASRQGVFLTGDGTLKMLTPNLLPGAATPATNVHVTNLNNAGKVSFTSEFTGNEADPNSGVYIASTTSTTLVAFEDTASPTAGKFFRRFFTESVALNQNGQLGFLAELSNTANGDSAGRGLYRYDPNTGLEQVAATGQAFQGSTIASLNFVGDFYSAGQPANSRNAMDADFSGLNSSGQMAFVYSLANGQGGVAIWTPTAAGVAGDYNGDNKVDALDYTFWRNHLNEALMLPNRNPNAVTPNLVDEEDFTFWKLNYGNSLGGGSIAVESSGGGQAIPEPISAMMLVIGSGVLALARARRRHPSF